MSSEAKNCNEQLMKENLLTYKRKKNSSEKPNPPEVQVQVKKRRRTECKDIGWAHGEMLNGMKQHWRCNYCGLVRHGGGVTRLKLHLVGRGDVRKCPHVPHHVVQEITSNLKLNEKKRRSKKKAEEEEEDESDYEDDEEDEDVEESLGTANDHFYCEVPEDPQQRTHYPGTVYDANDENKWKNWKHILENMLQDGLRSINDDSGVHTCIQNALYRTSASYLPNDNQEARETTTKKCKEALVNTLISDKFATLCNLLRNNFEHSEGQIVKYFDFSEIDFKMKNGDYERSPQMFIRDLRKIWEKFDKIGREMIHVANSLSIVSRNNIENEVGIQIKTDSPNPNQTESNHICNHCRLEITYNWGLIICKGCNTNYHKSCINPLITNPNHYYCSSCLSNNNNNNHNNNNILHINSDSDDTNSNTIQPCITAIYKLCKICGQKEHENNEFLLCAHPECPYKYYHTRCLTKCLINTGTQLRETGYYWYCPSCLCRVCLYDKDDDKIVLCDGCDEAFHIYCMDPVRETVPEGKWFCNKCGVKKRTEKGKKRDKNEVNKKEICFYNPETHNGMDLLLNAVDLLEVKERES